MSKTHYPHEYLLAAGFIIIGLIIGCLPCFGDTLIAEGVPYYPQSGQKVIINDVEYVIVGQYDWERLTNSIDKLTTIANRRWTIQHSTENGRREWHGKAVNTTFDTENHKKVTEYEDGYKYTEDFKKVTRQASTNSTRRVYSNIRPVTRPQNIPAGAWARIQERNAQKVKTVNATIGVGGKVINTTEVK